MRTMATVRAAALALAGLLTAPFASAAVLCVKPGGGGGCTTTIQAAVDTAHAGDKILVGAGTYYENVVVAAGKDGLFIGGINRSLTIVDANNYTDLGITTHNGPAFQILSPRVTIKGLTIRNGSDAGVDVEAPLAVITANTFAGLTGASSAGVSIGSGNAYNAVVTLNDIHDMVLGIASGSYGTLAKGNLVTSTVFGIYSTGDAAQVLNNKVYNSAAVGVFVTGDGATVQANDVRYGTVGIETAGSLPAVKLNRVTGTQLGIVTDCSNCFGGAVASNSVTDATAFGIIASSDDTGLNVQSNAVVRAGYGIAASGTGIFLTSNRPSDIGSFADGYCIGVFGDVNSASKNVVARCQGSGLYVNGSNNTLTGNLVSGTYENGITVDGCDSDGLGGCNPGPLAGNTLTSNRISGNAGQGVAIVGAADATRLFSNTVGKNRTDLCDEGTNTLLTGNAIGTTSASCDIRH